ncbi:hypothetical protein QFW96_07280 [Saccharopolyspora sp. TS4A08]|uniref:Uncharacterized protein n=1 Tax=Saccharopolyspora ipomoeae TaxID=3042027 RepID=A0ABT6PLN8_9PSEU|nr:hypothetical protein [Saccharopolyspora sp. TS4A08]MDI2028406.1 hypothetical protein [Saccharopolyspora sp. TS4A08]
MHTHTGVSSVDYLALVLRVLLLTGTALVAGIGLLRAGAAMRPLLAWACGGVTAALAAVSAVVLDINTGFAVAHVALAIAVPLALRWRGPAAFLGFGLALLLIAEAALGHTSLPFLLDTVVVAVAVVWFGLALAKSWNPDGGLRPRPIALTAAIALLGVGIGQLVLSGLLDRRLLSTGHGIAVLVLLIGAIAVLAVTLVIRDDGRTYRFGAVGVLAVVLAWATLPGLPLPQDLPVPGVARLDQAAGTPVLVSPNRVGRNLVHFPESAGQGITIEHGGTISRAVPKPGASGTWAVVDLPPGRSDLVIQRGEETGSVDVDTGDLPEVPGTAEPECASAALGTVAAGAPAPVTCPDTALLPEDADALRKNVAFLADMKVPSLAVDGDDTPRSKAAVEVVRAEAARRGVPLSGSSEGALLQVSGWAQASQNLERAWFVYGIHVAPWLLHGPVVTSAPGVAVPLRFDPRDRNALTYGMTQSSAFGDPPSLSGYREWARVLGENLSGEVTIYASAQVDVMQMGGHQHGGNSGQWIPQGTIVAVSSPLTEK